MVIVINDDENARHPDGQHVEGRAGPRAGATGVGGNYAAPARSLLPVGDLRDKRADLVIACGGDRILLQAARWLNA